MVKKLFKQEMVFYSRSFIPLIAILVGISIINRIIQFFESDSTTYNIVFVSSVTALIISAVVCLVMSLVIAVKRYYTNLFKSEGYLTFTLPAKNSQIIFTKLISAVLMILITVVGCLISVCIATSGEVFTELVKSFSYLLNFFIDRYSVHGVFYIIEAIILMFVFLCNIILLFYTCITVGQIFNKNRVAAAFGVYFAYYLLTQILGTVFIIIMNNFYYSSFIYKIVTFLQNYPKEFTHILLCSVIVFYIALNFLYYAITKYIMKHKLNIE